MSIDPDSSRVCERYAQAALALARTREERRELAEDLAAVGDILDASEGLRRVLANPLAKADSLRRILEPLRRPEGIGCRPRAWKLMDRLIGNRRTAILAGVIEACLGRLCRAEGIVRAEVTTARPLDARRREALLTALNRRIPEGGKVVLEEAVRPEILGGLILRIGSRLYDDSLAGGLRRLTTRMKRAEA